MCTGNVCQISTSSSKRVHRTKMIGNSGHNKTEVMIYTPSHATHSYHRNRHFVDDVVGSLPAKFRQNPFMG